MPARPNPGLDADHPGRSISGQASQWYEAADAAERRDDLQAAITALTLAVELSPARGDWHFRLGRLCLRQRRWCEAVAWFERAVALGPDRPLRHYWLGRARESSFDLLGAREAYAVALRLDPSRAGWAGRLADVVAAAAEFRPFGGTLVAHRGRVRGYPENAIEGLAGLPAHARGVEVDVRLTRDGVPVLMHDHRVDRTTSGTGEVAALDCAALPALHGAAAVPTLAAYLDACAGRALQLILLDLKPPVAADRSALGRVVRVVRDSPVADACLLMVRQPAQLALASRAGRGRVRLGCFGTTVEEVSDQVRSARRYGAELLLVTPGSRRYLANRAAVAAVREAGLIAGASTINSRAALEAARADGCEVILTDISDQLPHFTLNRSDHDKVDSDGL